MKKIVILSLLVGMNAYCYVEKAVEMNATTIPEFELLPISNARFNITNLTGHTLEDIKVAFKFCNKKFPEQESCKFTLGYVNFDKIRNRQKVRVVAHSAQSRQVKGNLSHTFNKVENVIIIRLNDHVYPFYLSKSLLHNENNLVISRLGDDDVIETREHYKSRL